MSIITIIKALFTIDVVGSEPITLNDESTVHSDWSLQAQDAKRILALYDRIPSGQLAMLEFADMDIAAIGSGLGHMNVQ